MLVYLDVNCVIYLIEKNPVWRPKIEARITTILTAGDQLALSELTRAECLVGPYTSGDAAVLASYQAFFSTPGIHLFPISSNACDRSARIRSSWRFKLPDALHLAIAIEQGCGLFLTNDQRLASFTGMPVEVLT